MNFGASYIQDRTVGRSATNYYGPPTAEAQADAIQRLIDKFNIVFYRSVNNPTRTDNYYLEQYYNAIKSRYWYALTQAQKNGLSGKLLGYQDRLRKKEAGASVPVYNPKPSAPAPVHPSGGATGTFTLPGDEDNVTIPLLNVRVPKKYIAYGAAAAGSVLAFTLVDRWKK